MILAALLFHALPPVPVPLPALHAPAPLVAAADNGGVYLQLTVGRTNARDSDGPAAAPTLEYDDGEAYGVALGLHFGDAEPCTLGLDLELEALYAENDIEGGAAPLVDTESSVAAALVNAVLEFSISEQFSIYGGGGVGLAALDVEDIEDGANVFELDSNTKVAWQVKAGLRLRLTRHLSANVGYRYLSVQEADLEDDINDVDFELETEMHVVEAGLRFTL